MSTPKCAKCGILTEKCKLNRIFLDRYVISDATVYVCGNCGEEYVDGKEYSRIFKEVQAIESKMRIPALQEVLAKVRFFVL